MKNGLKMTFFMLLTFLILNIDVAGDNQDSLRAFSIGDVYQVMGISGLDISPDGRKLLFSVTCYEMEKGEKNSDIYLLDLNTGQQNRLTVHPKDDSDPFWSSDGRIIYFISNREDGPQIWELDTRGGEARKISNFFTGISNPRISSGRNRVFFTSSVFPECMSDSDCNRKLSEQLQKGPVQVHMADSLLYRHWDSYREWRYSHLFYLDLSERKVHTLTSGQSDFPPVVEGSLGVGGGFCVSPDGQEVCVTWNPDVMLAGSTNSDLFLVELNNARSNLRNITEENKSYDGSPLYSPDGKYIAFLRQLIPGYEADRFRLALVDRQSHQIDILTEKLDNRVQDFCWSHDSHFIYFTIAEKGNSPIYRVRVKTRELERVLDGHSIREFAVTPDGKKMIIVKSKVAEPTEIWSYRIGSKGNLKRLTFFHQKLEQQVDLRPAESHWVTGEEGDRIQVFVVKPHGFAPGKNIH